MHIVKVVRRDLVREKIQSVAILMWYPKHCNILQHTATYFNTLQHNASHCKSLQSMQHTATHCNISQHIASNSNTYAKAHMLYIHTRTGIVPSICWQGGVPSLCMARPSPNQYKLRVGKGHTGDAQREWRAVADMSAQRAQRNLRLVSPT